MNKKRKRTNRNKRIIKQKIKKK
jgi:hypothetical protein